MRESHQISIFCSNQFTELSLTFLTAEKYSTWLVKNSLAHSSLVRTSCPSTPVRRLSAAPPPPPPTESAYHESYLNGSSGRERRYGCDHVTFSCRRLRGGHVRGLGTRPRECPSLLGLLLQVTVEGKDNPHLSLLELAATRPHPPWECPPNLTRFLWAASAAWPAWCLGAGRTTRQWRLTSLSRELSGDLPENCPLEVNIKSVLLDNVTGHMLLKLAPVLCTYYNVACSVSILTF